VARIQEVANQKPIEGLNDLDEKPNPEGTRFENPATSI
jgi:hypothetical protein